MNRGGGAGRGKWARRGFTQRPRRSDHAKGAGDFTQRPLSISPGPQRKKGGRGGIKLKSFGQASKKSLSGSPLKIFYKNWGFMLFRLNYFLVNIILLGEPNF
jgi:hypothetical protein